MYFKVTYFLKNSGIFSPNYINFDKVKIFHFVFWRWDYIFGFFQKNKKKREKKHKFTKKKVLVVKNCNSSKTIFLLIKRCVFFFSRSLHCSNANSPQNRVSEWKWRIFFFSERRKKKNIFFFTVQKKKKISQLILMTEKNIFTQRRKKERYFPPAFLFSSMVKRNKLSNNHFLCSHNQVTKILEKKSFLLHIFFSQPHCLEKKKGIGRSFIHCIENP